MNNTCYVKDTNYLQIQGWMVSRLGLKGNSLMIYAIIYGFSQDGQNMFKGTMNYLAQWTCSSKESVRQILNKLCESNLIIKEVEYINNVKFVYYRTNLEKVGGYTTLLAKQPNKVDEGIQQSWVINNINNNIDDSIKVDYSGKQIFTNESNHQTTFYSIKNLSMDKLKQLKQEVLENRDNRNKTYKEIQQEYHLVEKITYNTPEECDVWIQRKELEQSGQRWY